MEFNKFLELLKDIVNFSKNIILDREKLKKEILRIEGIEKYIRNIDNNYIYLNFSSLQSDQNEKEQNSYIDKKFSDLIKKNIMKKIKNKRSL